MKNDYTKALRYACSASFMEPENIALKQIIELAVARQVLVMSNPLRVLNKLDEICESYSFVKSLTAVKNIYAFNYLRLANEYFDKNKTDQGLQLIDLYEAIPGKSPLEPELISRSYMKASGAYLKEHNRKQARTYLLKGLERVPDDHDLTVSLELLK